MYFRRCGKNDPDRYSQPGVLHRGAVEDVEDALIYVQFMDDFLRRVGTALY
jgi:hypothetical protein